MVFWERSSYGLLLTKRYFKEVVCFLLPSGKHTRPGAKGHSLYSPYDLVRSVRNAVRSTPTRFCTSGLAGAGLCVGLVVWGPCCHILVEVLSMELFRALPMRGLVGSHG